MTQQYVGPATSFLAPTSPHLEAESLIIFEKYVENTSCYLEYGSGWSTVHALRMGARNIFSVDSSLEWVEMLQRHMVNDTNVEIIYCNIGDVGAWGRPVSNFGIKYYHEYMSKPWNAARRHNASPTVILIDGRFRVACFLYSLICAEIGTIILFDDYINRKNYHVVEKFCCLRQTFGRMAMFEVSKSYFLPDIISEIAKFSIVSE